MLPSSAWDLFAIGGVSFACLATLLILLSGMPAVALGSFSLFRLAQFRMSSEALEDYPMFINAVLKPVFIQLDLNCTPFALHLLIQEAYLLYQERVRHLLHLISAAAIIAYHRFMHDFIFLLPSAHTEPRSRECDR